VNKYHLTSYLVYVNTAKWILGKKITRRKAIPSTFPPRESEFRRCAAGMWDAFLCSSHEPVRQSTRCRWAINLAFATCKNSCMLEPLPHRIILRSAEHSNLNQKQYFRKGGYTINGTT
jgi:hypothetical protein